MGAVADSVGHAVLSRYGFVPLRSSCFNLTKRHGMPPPLMSFPPPARLPADARGSPGLCRRPIINQPPLDRSSLLCKPMQHAMAASWCSLAASVRARSSKALAPAASGCVEPHQVHERLAELHRPQGSSGPTPAPDPTLPSYIHRHGALFTHACVPYVADGARQPFAGHQRSQSTLRPAPDPQHCSCTRYISSGRALPGLASRTRWPAHWREPPCWPRPS